MKPWPRWFAWLAVAVTSLSILLGLINLIINTERTGTWLPLLILMPLLLVRAVASLRNPGDSR